MLIPFNKPFLTGKETEYIKDAVLSGKISGDGLFTKKCQIFFEEHYGFEKTLLTTSCTDALELSAILLNIKDGDEVIAPSYTFVSTVNAFVLRGAKIIFADSNSDNPNIDTGKIEGLISSKTKAIIVVHYAGIACDMDKVMQLSKKYKVHIVEDAAQSIDSFYKGKPLGSFGTFSAFSFHETKNIISGEGGMIVINDEKYIKRAEIIREKGTNRSAFFRGEVDKYGWVDIGSSYLPSDIIAAFLWAQIENLVDIQEKRKRIWNLYFSELSALEKGGKVKLPFIPAYATNNAHLFYILCGSLSERTKLIDFLKKRNIHSVFHYLSLHKSPYYRNKHDGRRLRFAEAYSNRLLRLPFYYEMSDRDINRVLESVYEFYDSADKWISPVNKLTPSSRTFKS